jgi:hypothetical protein
MLAQRKDEEEKERKAQLAEARRAKEAQARAREEARRRELMEARAQELEQHKRIIRWGLRWPAGPPCRAAPALSSPCWGRHTPRLP